MILSTLSRFAFKQLVNDTPIIKIDKLWSDSKKLQLTRWQASNRVIVTPVTFTETNKYLPRAEILFKQLK